MAERPELLLSLLAFIYWPILWLARILFPPKKFTGKSEEWADLVAITPEEWQLERFGDEEIYSIDGATCDGSWYNIEVVSHTKYVTATVHLHESGTTLEGQFTAPRSDNDEVLTVGPLTLELRQPFRRWRILFRGTLKNKETSENVVVSFVGWWKPTADARFFFANARVGAFVDTIFDTTTCFLSNFKLFSKVINAKVLSQSGQYYAEVTIGDQHFINRYRGYRERSPLKFIDTSEEIQLYLTDGNRLNFKRCTLNESDAHISHGFVAFSSQSVRSVLLSSHIDSLSADTIGVVKFDVAGGLPFTFRKNYVASTNTYLRSDGKLVTLHRVKVNSALARGFAVFKTVRESLRTVEPPRLPQLIADYNCDENERNLHIVPFTHRACQDKNFAGGKGANLARLKAVEHNFTVPAGVVITTSGFEAFLKNQPEVGALVQKLGQPGLDIDDCVKLGEQIQKEFQRVPIQHEFMSAMLDRFGLQSANVRFAVRSSAVGEDGSDLSSAGQLETFLAIPFQEVADKLVKCWCSNYRREVLNYRKMHGQILVPSMAVVIQQMVTDGVAGVMFTCDPVKNNSNEIVINAIRGIGEDIVSGVVTPDEIVFNKSTKTFTKPSPCCLRDDELSLLVEVGSMLEQLFGRSQDVEFVVKNGQLYIVQSRDVTGLDRETHFELTTEFDIATLTDKEVISTANVGEVTPSSMTPLELSIDYDAYDKSMTAKTLHDICGVVQRQYSTMFHMHGQRFLFNMGELLLRQHEMFRTDRLAEIVVAGMEVFTEDMFKQAEQRYPGLPKLYTPFRMLYMLKVMFQVSYDSLIKVKEVTSQVEALSPKDDAQLDFDRLYKIILKQRELKGQVISLHGDESMFSSFTYVLVGAIIRGQEKVMTAEMMSDFAKVFSNSTNHVISADVPSSLKKIAQAIKFDQLPSKLEGKEGKEAMAVLKRGETTAPLIKDFFEVHGHRGPKELYLRSTGWAEQPDLLVHTLKAMTKSKLEEKKEGPTTDEILDSLNCKPKGVQRQIMKYMLRQTHRGVASRETAKSCLVKTTFEQRKTVRAMAKLLCAHGYIADEDLIFFVTLEELQTLYKTRSAKIVSRAMRRRAIYKELDARDYEHVYHGNPEPIKHKTDANFETTDSMRGTTVCEGVVVAKARVAANLAEAQLTEPGEILITHCTDICWSPFFPIITGIVTEIGGLLSHGAVIAREYSLPSLIAVENATKVFKTGDLVELNATAGTISRVTGTS